MPVDTLELIRQLQDDFAVMGSLLQKLEQGVLRERNERQSAEERQRELEQLADPENDGYPFHNRW